MIPPRTRKEWQALSPDEQDALIRSGWHPGPTPAQKQALQEVLDGKREVHVVSSPFDVIRHSLNQLTDHGSQGCLDCLHHRMAAMAAVDELEARYGA